MKSPKTMYPHEFLFKASWPSTALKFRVEAQNLKQAQLRAEGRVSKMEGGISCLKVELVEQLR